MDHQSHEAAVTTVSVRSFAFYDISLVTADREHEGGVTAVWQRSGGCFITMCSTWGVHSTAWRFKPATIQSNVGHHSSVLEAATHHGALITHSSLYQCLLETLLCSFF